jgi:hypothetical protein
MQGGAEAAGIDWSDHDLTAELGSTDGGRSTVLIFTRKGPAGTYSVEISASTLRGPATARATFIAERKESLAMLRQLPGFQLAGPKQGPVELESERDEKGLLIDVVASSPDAKVLLTLPDGNSIDETVNRRGEVEWKKIGNRDQVDPPGAMFGIAGFLLPFEGTHHVIMMENAARGTYTLSAPGQIQLTAALLPLGRLFEEATEALGKPPQVPPGEVLLQPYALPVNVFAGDTVPLQVRLLGDPVREPVQFRVRAEYRVFLPRGNSPSQQLGPPIIEEVPVTFTRDAEGLYKSSFTVARAGTLRVEVRASGQRTSGQPFDHAVKIPEVLVEPLVARIRSLSEKSVDADGNGTFDRLEVTAQLNVVVPGDYRMQLMIEAPGGAPGLLFDANATLRAGDQSLTARIPAERIRKRLKDGPWIIRPPQISRKEPNSAYTAGFVALLPQPLTTAPYKRSQWDAGAQRAEEILVARGIRPAASGKFRSLELEVPVVTKGGLCGWHASLSPRGPAGEFLPGAASLSSSVTVPSGPVKVTAVFDGALVAAANTRRWSGNIMFLNCAGGELRYDGPPFLEFTLDPTQFQARKEPFRLEVTAAPRLTAGNSDYGQIRIADGEQRPVVFRVEGTIPGVEIRMQRVDPASNADILFLAGPQAKPGRYFLPISATEARGTATTELVVEIEAPGR